MTIEAFVRPSLVTCVEPVTFGGDSVGLNRKATAPAAIRTASATAILNSRVRELTTSFGWAGAGVLIPPGGTTLPVGAEVTAAPCAAAARAADLPESVSRFSRLSSLRRSAAL